jgi:hypothetical protein
MADSGLQHYDVWLDAKKIAFPGLEAEPTNNRLANNHILYPRSSMKD